MAPQASLQVQRPAFSCPKCGFSQEKGEACVRCGIFFSKLAARAEQDFNTFKNHLPGGAARPVMSETEEKNQAMLCHLMVFSGFIIPFGNVLGPLVVWLMNRKKSEFVDYHGKIAINFQLTLLMFLFGSTALLAFNSFLAIILGPVILLLLPYSLFVVISSAIKANNGEYTEITLSANLVK
jgi:uncharacterized Tic20 family protein